MSHLCSQFLFFALSILFASVFAQPRKTQSNVEPFALQAQDLGGIRQGPQDILHDSELIDVVLVASVDGKFHALNRTSGAKLWSMSSITTPEPSSGPTTLAPLVRTSHVDADPETHDSSTPHETYIIEPQTGDIYVMASPSSPLQRFPYSMSQLVDISPFSFKIGENDRRVIVGRKETSLFLVELETGKVKATIDPQCPWDPFEDFLDLDELESSDSSTGRTTEVFIGRTDYHISIYTRSERRNSQRTPIQNLSFSSYGPNNQDMHLQTQYRHTKDNAYILSLPNGQIMSFRSSSDRYDGEWAKKFSQPIVAVFDVFNKLSPDEPESNTPFVLLQPRINLKDLFPDSSPLHSLPNHENAFIGMVEESGSLYAMSPERYPLVAFGDSETVERGRLGSKAAHHGIDDITHERLRREEEEKLDELCKTDPLADRRCVIGIRRIEDGDQKPLLLPAPPNDSNTSFGSLEEEEPASEVQVGDLPPPSINWRMFLLSITIGSCFVWLTISRVFSWKVPHPIHPSNLPEKALSSTDLAVAGASKIDSSDLISSPLKESTESPESKEFNGGALHEPIDVSEQESTAPLVSEKRKIRRGKRGGGGKKKNNLPQNVDLTENGHPLGQQSSLDDPEKTPQANISFESPRNVSESPQSLVVSDTILGFGSHGTVVYQGSLQGRAVAVKRLLQDFVTLASREVSILQESDYHPNVIRYYYQESHANFLYIALELCPASLADIIEAPDRDQWRDIAISFDPKKALQQITAGLRHLHGLKLVHRDIKPQNILISSVKSVRDKPSYRMLISDFGLCKKLDVDQTSFLPTAHGPMAAGTVGWRAPEVLRGEVKLDDVDENSVSSRGSVGSASGANSSKSSAPTRLTKSIDIFALGCLFFYTLTNGAHPFGDRFEREINILKGSKCLDGLERFGEEGSDAVDLIDQMLDPEASKRPDTKSCLVHPFFWDPGRRLNFLQDASDRFEIMCRDPKDSNLIELEKGSFEIVGKDWQARLDKTFIENLGKFRKYDVSSVQDLLRALRNKKNHYQDLPDNVKRHLGPLPEGFLGYFTRRYPRLFLHVHTVIGSSPLRTEPMFRSYFELSD